MEVVRNRGEQLVHDSLKRAKGPGQRLLRHVADAQTWAVWSVSRRQPPAIGMQQAHVHPEACAAEMQTVEPDQWRFRLRSLVSHMACNVKTMSSPSKARMAMSRS